MIASRTGNLSLSLSLSLSLWRSRNEKAIVRSVQNRKKSSKWCFEKDAFVWSVHGVKRLSLKIREFSERLLNFHSRSHLLSLSLFLSSPCNFHSPLKRQVRECSIPLSLSLSLFLFASSLHAPLCAGPYRTTVASVRTNENQKTRHRNCARRFEIFRFVFT